MNILHHSQGQNHSGVVILTQNGNSLPEHLASHYEKYISHSGNACFAFIESSIFVAQLNPEQNEDLTAEKARVLGGDTLQKVESLHLKNIKIVSEFQNEITKAFVEGLLLASYRFDKYKKKKETPELSSILVNLHAADIEELQAVSNITELVRDLVNEPVSFLNTSNFSQTIEATGKKYGFEVEVLEKKQIESLKMGGLLGVNKGSSIAPSFNILTWKPQNALNEKPYVFVGKGVVYDTGGYNLKPGSYMDTMKSDMAGGGAVVGVLSMVAQMKLPLYVVGLIPATDNRISPDALVSDDIITMMDGTTVEIKNTDAEGRLILADALVFAQKYQPELVIDLATLTGAAARITAHYGSAMMGNASDFQKQQLKQVGNKVYERLVEIPFWNEFYEDLKSSVADLKNIGNPEGGASSAGKFLEHFTNYPWIHIDIAGSAFLSKPYKYFQSGSTAVGVRLLYQFLKQIANEKGGL